MPCLICGSPTKGDSVICEKCLQKELQKKSGEKKAEPQKPASGDTEDISLDLDNIFIDESLSVDSDEDLAIEPVTEEKEKGQPARESEDDEIKLGEDIELDLDNIFTEKPQPESSEPETSGKDTDAIKENIRKKFESLRLDKSESTKTPSSEKKENMDSDIELDGLDDIFSASFEETDDSAEQDVKESGTALSLNLDEEPAPEGELDLDSINLDLNEPKEEDDKGLDFEGQEVDEIEIKAEEEVEEADEVDEVDPDQLKQVIADDVESDEEILKKSIRDRLKQKININEPEMKSEESVDDLLDEAILEEIEEVKREAEVKQENPEPEISLSDEKEKAPLFKQESKPKDIDSGEWKKKTADIPLSIPEKPLDKKKPLIPEHPQAEGKVIRGTTSKRTPGTRKKEKSGVSKIFMIILILIILGGGGYFAYTKFLTSDPQKEQLMAMLAEAQNKEQRGELEAALSLYTNIASKFSNYPEAAKAKNAIPRLKQEVENLKKENEIRKKVNDLLIEANNLFERKRWMSSRGKDAFGLYQEILKLDPDNAEAKNKIEEMKLGYLDMGNKALTAGNYSLAKRYFLNVLAIDPNYTQASALVSTCDALLSQKARLEEEKRAEQRRLEEMQRQLQQRMLEEKRKQEEEARRIAEQKRLEEQRKLEEQKRLEEQKKKEEDFRNKILLEAQIDGGKREYIRRVKPAYAGRLTKQTDVIVQVIVGNDGVPESVRVLKTGNQDLAKVVVDAVKKFRYKPPTYKGKPCKMSLIERFTFKPSY